jgi:flagellar motor switch protein FliG
VGNEGSPFNDQTTSLEKAGILLASLENSLAVDILKKLDPEDLKLLVESSSNLGLLTVRDVEPIVEKFTEEISGVPRISAGTDQLMSLLESAFNPQELAELLGRPVPKLQEDSVWRKLTVGMEPVIVAYLLDQHEQVAAFVLTKLKPEMAARCLTIFPRESRASIARRLLGIVDAYPPAAETLQCVVLEDLFGKNSQSKQSAGKDLLAAVINRLEHPQSEEILGDLRNSNPDETAALRKMIFMFEDIPRLDQKDCTKLIDRVSTELIIPALFGMDQEFRESILSVMSPRSRRMVESELQEGADQPNKDTLASRRKIADLAMAMARKDELKLPESESTQEAQAAAA